jgi:hypothetical protein
MTRARPPILPVRGASRGAGRRTPLRGSALSLGSVLPLALALLIAPAGAAAQSVAQVPAGVLRGRVQDAATGLPVAAAIVTLEPASPGLLIDPATAAAVPARSQVTGEGGTYRFTDVVPGRYRLRVERLGYRAATIEVEVRQPVAATVSVGLELEPVALEPVQVEQRAASPFERSTGRAAEPEDARVLSERLRQALFLAPDARMLTYADVMDGVTLGEGDVLRALHRLPGVGTRDDYTAELWTRGSPWPHTRVTFDGVPLFNPLHAVGVLSAIPPEILGAVFFHPGVRPAAAAGGAAGALDLRTRPAGGDGGVRAAADVSMASAKLALDQRIGERSGWVVVARRSHLDLLARGFGWLGLDTEDLPYAFQDVSARVDIGPARGIAIEASGVWEQDRVYGDVAGVLERTQARWGNAAGRVTLRSALRGVAFEQTVAASRFDAHTSARLLRTRQRSGAVADEWIEPPSTNEVRYAQARGALSPATGGSAAPWSVGYDIAWMRALYDGPPPRYHAARPETTARFVYSGELLVSAVWAEARIALGERLTLGPALRLEAGTRVANGGALRVAPALAARYALSEAHTVAGGIGRSWQYDQAIALAGPSIHPAFHASHFRVLAGAHAPAIRADIATLGTERWLGRGWLASATAFVRRADGIALPDPTPGPLAGRPLYVVGRNDARGVELAVRRMGARWSGSLGYTYGLSEVEAAGFRYPAPADRRHTVDLMAAVRISDALRIAAAFTAASGAPFTRAISRSPDDCATFGFGCGSPHAIIDAPNAERTPPYHALDAALHWARAFGPVEVSAYLQVRNVLGAENAITYAGTIPVGTIMRRNGEREIVWDDRFEPGLPRLPLLGLRVTF